MESFEPAKNLSEDDIMNELCIESWRWSNKIIRCEFFCPVYEIVIMFVNDFKHLHVETKQKSNKASI